MAVAVVFVVVVVVIMVVVVFVVFVVVIGIFAITTFNISMVWLGGRGWCWCCFYGGVVVVGICV